MNKNVCNHSGEKTKLCNSCKSRKQIHYFALVDMGIFAVQVELSDSVDEAYIFVDSIER